MTHSLIQKMVCAAGAAMITASIVSTSAAQAETPRSREVAVADLNLNAEAGKATLAARVRGAAEAVCRADGISPREVSASKRCVENAVETAMAKAASLS